MKRSCYVTTKRIEHGIAIPKPKISGLLVLDVCFNTSLYDRTSGRLTNMRCIHDVPKNHKYSYTCPATNISVKDAALPGRMKEDF